MQNINAIKTTTDLIEFSWDRPSGLIDYYIIRCKLISNVTVGLDYVKRESNYATSSSCFNLLPGKNYEITIESHRKSLTTYNVALFKTSMNICFN